MSSESNSVSNSDESPKPVTNPKPIPRRSGWLSTQPTIITETTDSRVTNDTASVENKDTNASTPGIKRMLSDDGTLTKKPSPRSTEKPPPKKVKQTPIKTITTDTESETDLTLSDEEANAFNNETGAARVIRWSRTRHPPNEAPPGWREIWRGIAMMRSPEAIGGFAAVDTMGCHTLADTTLDPKVFRFQSLVGLMLSSQTRDENTSAAVEKLKQLPGGLTIDSILEAPEEALAEAMRNVSFYRNKTKFLKGTAKILKEQYDNDIPKTVEGLVKLPGVGPKMANLCVQIAYGTIEGIGVDVHVHRITNRFRWHKTSQPEGTRKALEQWLPRPLWDRINPMLVGFGQKVCRAIAPRCSQCLLAAQDLCPSARAADRREARVLYEAKEDSTLGKLVNWDLPRQAVQTVRTMKYPGPVMDEANRDREVLEWHKLIQSCHESDHGRPDADQLTDETLRTAVLLEMFMSSERQYEVKLREKRT